MRTQSHTDLFGLKSGAQFSDCHTYRYQLWRIWDEGRPKALCIGLNPSTADGLTDDATIRVLKKVLNRLGYGGFYMANLYAFISRDPKVLKNCEDPIGENDTVIEKLSQSCDAIIFCWGNSTLNEERPEFFVARFPQALCFDQTKKGAPTHPLALMYQGRTGDARLMTFNEDRPVTELNRTEY